MMTNDINIFWAWETLARPSERRPNRLIVAEGTPNDERLANCGTSMTSCWWLHRTEDLGTAAVFSLISFEDFLMSLDNVTEVEVLSNQPPTHRVPSGRTTASAFTSFLEKSHSGTRRRSGGGLFCPVGDERLCCVVSLSSCKNLDWETPPSVFHGMMM